MCGQHEDEMLSPKPGTGTGTLKILETGTENYTYI